MMQLPNTKKFEFWFLVLITISAFAVRFYGINFSLSNDELSALSRLRFNTISDVIEYGVKPDGHPAGVQVFLYFIVQLFGDSELSLRLPFVIFGSLSVLLMYKISKDWFGENTAYFASISIAFLEFPVLYSQIARPYGSGLFLSLLMVYVFNKAFYKLENASELKRWTWSLTFGLVLALNAYNHYFSAFLAAIFSLFCFFLIQKKQWKYYLVSLAFSILLFLPHLPITLNILKIGGVGEWLGKPQNDWFLRHILYIFNDSVFLTTSTFLLLIALQIRRKSNFVFNRFHALSVFLFITPFLVGFFYSKYVNPVLQNSVLLFSMPFFLLFIFSFIPQNKSFKWIAATFGIMLFVHSFFIHSYHQKQHFDEFKETAKFMVEWEKEFGKENILVLENISSPTYIEYYSHQPFDVKISNLLSENDIQKLQEIIENNQQKYCIYLKTSVGNEQVFSLIRSQFPACIFSKKYGTFSEIYLFSREEKDDLFTKNMKLLHEYKILRNDTSNQQIESYSEEFMFGVDLKLIPKKKYLLEAKAEIYQDSTNTDALFVLTSLDKNQKSIQWFACDFKYFAVKDSIKKVYWTKEFVPSLYLSGAIGIEDEEINCKVYIYNPKKNTLKFRKLEYKIYERKN